VAVLLQIKFMSGGEKS